MNNKRYGLRAETALRDVLVARGYLCIRSAASKVLDLVCVRPRGRNDYLPWGIEVKATSGDVVRISRNGKQREQYEELVRIVHTYPILTWYAVRWGDATFEFFYPREIMHRGSGLSIDVLFPDLQRHTGNNPPIRFPLGEHIAPPEYDTQGGATD